MLVYAAMLNVNRRDRQYNNCNNNNNGKRMN